MKILIFEYITGGGFSSADLPTALAHEGRLMLNALLADFASLPTHKVFVMLDTRCLIEPVAKNIQIISVKPQADVFAIFDQALQDCDAAWIIAPETDAILLNFTQRVEKANKRLLSAPSSAIAKTADKLQTFHQLAAQHILTIPTQSLSELPETLKFPQVIKPRDGVGGENSFFIQTETDLNHALQQITEPEHYILQPFISGAALSISALFNQGTAQLLCVNRQVMSIKNQQFQLLACEVNIPVDNKPFQQLLNQIANGFSDLCGYVGIDLIVCDTKPDQIYVVEINPRLTSSYSGIKQALGLNIAALVLESLNAPARINPLCNQTIFVPIAQEKI